MILMKLRKILSNLFGKNLKTESKSQEIARAKTIERIEARGYKLVDVSGRYNGKIAARRYILTDPKGNTLDNNGNGFACSSDALKSIRNEPRIK
jgi:hypothetical protein